MALYEIVIQLENGRILRKRIPDNIKREVEIKRHEREERRDEYAREYREPNIRKSEPAISNQSIQRDSEARGRTNIPIQSSGNITRHIKKTRFDWTGN